MFDQHYQRLQEILYLPGRREEIVVRLQIRSFLRIGERLVLKLLLLLFFPLVPFLLQNLTAQLSLPIFRREFDSIVLENVFHDYSPLLGIKSLGPLGRGIRFSTTQICPTQISPPQVRATQISPYQKGITQISSPQISPTQVSPTQVSPTQISSTQTQLPQIHLHQISFRPPHGQTRRHLFLPTQLFQPSMSFFFR